MQGIDMRMKELGIKHFGKEVMGKLTDEEIVQARCETFRYFDFLVLLGPPQKGEIEYVFCEIFVKDLLARKELNQGKEEVNGKAESKD